MDLNKNILARRSFNDFVAKYKREFEFCLNYTKEIFYYPSCLRMAADVNPFNTLLSLSKAEIANIFLRYSDSQLKQRFDLIRFVKYK